MAIRFENFGIKALKSRHIFFQALSDSRRLGRMSQLLDKVPDVDIDGHGRFKYILIQVHDDTNNVSKTIVRGYARSQWHSDIFDETGLQLQSIPGLRPKCLGGGRIEHDPDERILKVYGYSQGFGKADHDVTVGILEKRFPDYTISSSDEGY
ncbi:sex-regulated protein janus-A [Osmia lignaria lignaria]|uniref:sex-regulated protein janus-A n=1 Tax=Osmia lignaria lignaria TaxID=1437193 RepID=UPI00147934BD|nr:sex-regulated protein janus-A-like [Osmia lignaria]